MTDKDPIAQQLGSRGWEPVTAACAYCGAAFETKRRTRGGLQPALYCSASHRTMAWQDRRKVQPVEE